MPDRLNKFEITPEENEQIEATIILPKESRSVLHGVVKNYRNCEVENAVVKVFEMVEHCGEYNLTPIGHTFTDKFGQFLFGPLCSGRHYVVKVWVNDVRIREIVVTPKPDDTCKHYGDTDNCEDDEEDECEE